MKKLILGILILLFIGCAKMHSPSRHLKVIEQEYKKGQIYLLVGEKNLFIVINDSSDVLFVRTDGAPAISHEQLLFNMRDYK